MNTGVQKSGATPEGAWTTTTPASSPRAGQKKDIARIMAAHGIPYVATLALGSVPMLRDFRAKVARAADVSGLPVPAHPRPVPARLALPDRPVDRDRPSRRRVAVLPAPRLRPRGLEDHVPAEARRSRARVPRDTGTLQPPVGRADRRHPGSRGRALGAAGRPGRGIAANDHSRTGGPGGRSGSGADTLRPSRSPSRRRGAGRDPHPLHLDARVRPGNRLVGLC